MSTLAKNYITPEQYLEIDRQAECKSEYYRGEMFAKAGASWAHNLIVLNLLGELGQQLRAGPCTPCPSDMRVRVSSTGLYAYPDALIVCGSPQFLDQDHNTLLNPTVIFEVLSPSTESYDRGTKAQLYRSLESLREYVLVSSLHMSVEVFTRQSGNQWLLIPATQRDEVVEIQSAGCRLKLVDIYEKVDFSDADPGVGHVGPLHP
jgi:Uma2 family endonuclease